jgi:hypothetical protein
MNDEWNMSELNGQKYSTVTFCKICNPEIGRGLGGVGPEMVPADTYGSDAVKCGAAHRRATCPRGVIHVQKEGVGPNVVGKEDENRCTET